MDISAIHGSSGLAPDLVRQMHLAGDNRALQTKAAAKQFEAILMKQFLDKSVGSMMGSGAGSDVYGYMLTDVLSQKLADSGGLGMASLLERQFTPAGQATGKTAETAGKETS